MSNALHSAQTVTEGIHIIHAWEYTSTTARDAANYTSTDEGKVARVGSTAPYDFYVLSNAIGPTWEQIGNTGTVVKKGTIGTIAAFKVIYATGYDVASGVPEVELADADSNLTMPAIGISTSIITNTTSGAVVISGVITGMDTSSWSVGDGLYVSSTAGELTSTKPTGTQLIQKVAEVIYSDASNGAIMVIGVGRTNDLPNLPEHYIWRGNASGVPEEIRNNFSATVNPTTGDDNVNGYSVGSIWINTTDDLGFVCVDATTASAVWHAFTINVHEVSVTNLDATMNNSTPSLINGMTTSGNTPPAALWKFTFNASIVGTEMDQKIKLQFYKAGVAVGPEFELHNMSSHLHETTYIATCIDVIDLDGMQDVEIRLDSDGDDAVIMERHMYWELVGP